MKFKFSFLLFFVCFLLVSAQDKHQIEKLVNYIIFENPDYLSMKLNYESFVPELPESLKKEENFKHTMKEVRNNNFHKYFEKVKFTNKINWKDYNIKEFKETKSKYKIQISTPIFIKKNKEALVQIKTNYSNWYNVYKLNKENNWQLSYAFGEKMLPKEK